MRGYKCGDYSLLFTLAGILHNGFNAACPECVDVSIDGPFKNKYKTRKLHEWIVDSGATVETA